MMHVFKYATLNQDVMDIPAGTEVLVLSRFYGTVEGICHLHIEPHPTDETCDWSTLSGVPEEWLTYTGKAWNYHINQYEFDVV